MACNCGSKKAGTSTKWTHTSPSGKSTSYSSEMDARMAASREGGTVKRG